MLDSSENRKIKMTKLALKDALVELLLENPLRKITVTALCRQADVNRSTFYSHYQDIFSVMDDLEEEFVRHVAYIKESCTREENRQTLKNYLQYAREKKTTFNVLLINGKMTEPVMRESMQLYDTEHPDAAQQQRSEHELYTRFACMGTFHLIYQWLQKEEAYTLDFITDTILSLMVQLKESEENGLPFPY